MICPKCGKELKDGVNFCSKCGVSFKQTKKKNPVILILILLGIAIAVWVVLFFVLKPSGEEDGDNDDPVVETEDKTQEENEAEDSRDEENKVNVDDIINQQKANTEFPGNTMANLHNGGDVVSDGENVYFYEFGCIYKLDNAGNVEKLYTMSDERAASKYSGKTQLQVQNGVLYFKDKYHIVAYDLGTKQVGYLLNGVYDFVVDGEYIYYTTRENYDEEANYLYGTFVVGKYSFTDATLVGSISMEEWGEVPFILGKSPVKENEILMAQIIYEMPENIEDADNSDIKAYLLISGTDFASIDEEAKIECGVYWGLSECVKSKNYLYMLDSPEDLSMNYYDESREYLIPEVISEDDWQNTLDKVDPEVKPYIIDYYKKYDINNLRPKDEDRKDELLEEYPILAEKVIYVLNPKIQANMKSIFERYFAEAGITEDLMAKSEEMIRDRTIPRTVAKIRCINLQTMQEEYLIQEQLYFYSILGAYENDLIIYARINEKMGIYRIAEKSLLESGFNGEGLSVQLLLETPYGFGGRLDEHLDVYVVDEYLYYRYKDLSDTIPVETEGLLQGRMQRIALTDTGMLGDEPCGEVLTDSIY